MDKRYIYITKTLIISKDLQIQFSTNWIVTTFKYYTITKLYFLQYYRFVTSPLYDYIFVIIVIELIIKLHISLFIAQQILSFV